MPRKYDDEKRREWLKLFEEGKTEKWIAKYVHCDLRTVKKVINEERLKRDVVTARIELLKEALRKHQDSLLEELDQIISSLVIPAKDLACLSWHRGRDSVLNEPDDQIKTEQSVESTMRRLLKEHLKNDKLWRALNQWRKANASDFAARVALQRKTAALLMEKTGYKLVDNDNSPPFIYSYNAGPLLYNTVIKVAFETPEEIATEVTISNLETAISINLDNGDVRYRNDLILALAPGKAQETKRDLLDAFRNLMESPEVKTVVEAFRELEQITTKTRQIAEDIKLIGLVPGQCQICRRLGM